MSEELIKDKECAACERIFSCEGKPKKVVSCLHYEERTSVYHLERCPCCNGKARTAIPARRYFDFYIVVCTECGLQTKECNSEERAVELWNRRC